MAFNPPKAIKVDGIDYPTRTAAILALAPQGLTHKVIADKVGMTVNSVGSIIVQQRRKGNLPTPDAGNIWTEAKIEKAVRVFPAIVDDVARLLAVPSPELRDLWIKGKQPALPAPVAPEPPAYVPPPPEAFEPVEGDAPGRDDDEAELARLQAEDEAEQEQEAPAKPMSRFPDAAARAPAGPTPAVTGDVWLKDEMGRFLHESLDGMTSNPRFAWKGDAGKLKVVLNRLPHLRQLDQVPVAR